ncbi:hypothetical protein MMX123_02740 [Microbacterium sp. MM2322]|uniref:hypothetical protein n=1 Tax=Microbacterium sp. MM2322 TaxID=3157631 RepID=UPI003D806E49
MGVNTRSLPRSLWRAAAVLFCCSMIAGCASETSVLTDKVDLPGLWLQADPDVLRSFRTLEPEDVGTELHENGTAQAFNLPAGKGRKVDSYWCFDRSGETYPGDATWSATEGGLLTIEYGEETFFWADNGFMRSLDWVNLTLADCDAAGQAPFSGP